MVEELNYASLLVSSLIPDLDLMFVHSKLSSLKIELLLLFVTFGKNKSFQEKIDISRENLTFQDKKMTIQDIALQISLIWDILFSVGMKVFY